MTNVVDFPDMTDHALDSVHAEILESLNRLSEANQWQLLVLMIGDIIADSNNPQASLRLTLEFVEEAATGVGQHSA